MKLIFFVVLLMTSGALAEVSELFEKTISLEIEESNQQTAKKKMLDEANSQISNELIMSLIGNEKFEKNNLLIKSRILKQSDKYILFSKPGDLLQAGENKYKLSVQLKVSIKELKTILQNNGLLNTFEGYRTLVPLFTVTDSDSGDQYGWWFGSGNNSAKKYYNVIDQSLDSIFVKNEIYYIKARDYPLRNNIPSIYQVAQLTNEDKDFFSSYFQSPLILDGHLQIKIDRERHYQIDLKLSVMQTFDGKIVADIKKKWEIPTDKLSASMETIAQDLASQVKDGWQRGVIGTDLIRLTFKGFYNPKKMNQLKEKLKSELLIVRNLKEREITSESIVFEANTTSSFEEIVKKIIQIDFDGKVFSHISSANGEIVFQ